MARLKEKFAKEVAPRLQERFGIANQIEAATVAKAQPSA